MKAMMKNKNSQYWWCLYMDALAENIVLEKKIKELEKKVKKLERELAARTRDDM
jgi:hypothetical protein